MADTTFILILPNGPELIQTINRNLISNAKRSTVPSLTLPSLKTTALHIVQEDALLPLTEVME